MSKLVPLFLLSIFFIQCSGSDSHEESIEVDSTTSTISVVYDENDYATDWVNFVEAVKTNDTTAIDQMNETAVESAHILALCSENWVIDQLNATNYHDIIEVDYNGELLKEFAADDIAEIDGVEYGAGLYLYFKETPNGLKLVDYLSAG